MLGLGSVIKGPDPAKVLQIVGRGATRPGESLNCVVNLNLHFLQLETLLPSKAE